MARKVKPKTALTQRERECRRVAQEKSRRKFWQACWWRLRVATAGLAVITFLALSVWEWRDDGVSESVTAAVDAGYAATARGGFALSAMYLEGRVRTPLAEVESALDVARGQPILALSLTDMRTRLEAIPSVKHASVERSLPGTLHVTLMERRPVALWQHKGALHLIDDEGTVMDDLAAEDFRQLPLLVGQAAPENVSEAMAILRAQPGTVSQIAALIYVGQRRWNIHMRQGMEVKLPEAAPEVAWAEFAALAQVRNVFAMPLAVVDLRLNGRMVLKPKPVEALPVHLHHLEPARGARDA